MAATGVSVPVRRAITECSPSRIPTTRPAPWRSSSCSRRRDHLVLRRWILLQNNFLLVPCPVQCRCLVDLKWEPVPLIRSEENLLITPFAVTVKPPELLQYGIIQGWLVLVGTLNYRPWVVGKGGWISFRFSWRIISRRQVDISQLLFPFARLLYRKVKGEK